MPFKQRFADCLLLCSAPISGPFGVDMMVVARPEADGFLLHPCVEINLRRTMGHVALTIPRRGVMQVAYTDNHYKLRIRPV